MPRGIPNKPREEEIIPGETAEDRTVKYCEEALIRNAMSCYSISPTKLRKAEVREDGSVLLYIQGQKKPLHYKQ